MKTENRMSVTGSFSFVVGCLLLFSLATTGVAVAQNPVPLVNQPLVPDAVNPGGSGFTLNVNGTGFVLGASKAAATTVGKQVASSTDATASGLEYDAVILSTGQGTEPMQVGGKVWASHSNFRFDFADDPSSKGGSIQSIVSRDGGQSFFFLDSITRAFLKIDAATVTQQKARVGVSNVSSSKDSEPRGTKLVDEAAQNILGLPVRHYEFREEVPPSGKPDKTVTGEILDDVWTTTALTIPALNLPQAPNPLFLFAPQLETFNAPKDADLRGFQLRRILKIKLRDPDGKLRSLEIQMEVKALQQLAIPDSVFEVPAGFKQHTSATAVPSQTR